MATYAYKCSDCDNAFDIIATIKEKEEGKSDKFACPKCQSKNIKQEFSAVNFIKNVFRGDKKAGGCGCGGEVCGPNDKINRENSGGCCGGKNESCY